MHELSGALVGSSRKSKAIEIAHVPTSMLTFEVFVENARIQDIVIQNSHAALTVYLSYDTCNAEI